jgi:hypothetical protein
VAGAQRRKVMAKSGLRWAAKRAYLEMLRFLPDRLAVNLDYFRVFGTFPDLANPRRFSEKIQHLKLSVHDPRTPELVDKVRVKSFVSTALGEQWLIPTLWHGPEVTEDVLRNVPKPAVLKANHSSAQVLFLHANSNFDAAARTANNWISYDHHIVHREWAYSQVRRELLIEPFIGEEQAPIDYKFWVFDGAVRFIQLDQDRFSRHTRQFYSPSWRRLDFSMNYPPAPANAAAPQHLRDMLHAASVLSNGFRFVRVDLYDTADGPLFGEMTFAPEAGLCRFDPPWFDLKLGESWSYPQSPTEQERLHSLADAFLFKSRDP